jgi:hypothetical protein
MEYIGIKASYPYAVLGKLSPIEYLDKYNLKMNYSV